MAAAVSGGPGPLSGARPKRGADLQRILRTPSLSSGLCYVSCASALLEDEECLVFERAKVARMQVGYTGKEHRHLFDEAEVRSARDFNHVFSRGPARTSRNINDQSAT